MSDRDDPRVFFAAERTLLAWIRTGIAVMGLGFIVAKFGMFLRYIAHDMPAPGYKTGVSLVIGTAMVVCGALACAKAAVQFRRFSRQLIEREMPAHWSPDLAILFAWALAGSGLLLALYLVL